MSKLSWKAEVLKLPLFYGHIYSLAVCFCICILQFFATTLQHTAHVTYSERRVELEFIVVFHPTVLLLQDVQVWLHGT